ncbi:MAG: tyrosine-type recombinase/integrase [Anaerolineae bacterium]|nr:tyrosine-type recombinase/integrase [Anaerolineae bacterium]
MNTLTLNRVFEGYLLHLEAKRLSHNTINTYTYAFNKLTQVIPGEATFTSITTDQIAACLALQSQLSNKTLLNVHAALSAFWSWAVVQGFAGANPVESIARPRPEKREIIPFTRDDVLALLRACDHTRSYSRPGKRECANSRPSALRDRTIILLLLDTGLRASELCTLRIHDVDLTNRYVVVQGKGNNERLLPIDATTSQTIWKYLSGREDQDRERLDDPLFVTSERNPLDRQQLRHILDHLGTRAAIRSVHPHRFRHTFAITYLRNGGDIYTLQRCLGHTTLDMVKRYLSIAQSDVQAAHRRASPVANWKL